MTLRQIWQELVEQKLILSYGRRANVGLEGYINEQDLKEAKDLTYVLKKDSPILRMLSLKN